MNGRGRRRWIGAMARAAAEMIADGELAKQRGEFLAGLWATIEREAHAQGFDAYAVRTRRPSVLRPLSAVPPDREWFEDAGRARWIDRVGVELRAGLRAAGCRVLSDWIPRY